MDLLAAATGMTALSNRLASASVHGTITPTLLVDAKLQLGAASLVLSEQRHGSHAAEGLLAAAERLSPNLTRVSDAIKALDTGATFLKTRALYRGAFG